MFSRSFHRFLSESPPLLGGRLRISTHRPLWTFFEVTHRKRLQCCRLRFAGDGELFWLVQCDTRLPITCIKPKTSIWGQFHGIAQGEVTSLGHFLCHLCHPRRPRRPINCPRDKPHNCKSKDKSEHNTNRISPYRRFHFLFSLRRSRSPLIISSLASMLHCMTVFTRLSVFLAVARSARRAAISLRTMSKKYLRGGQSISIPASTSKASTTSCFVGRSVIRGSLISLAPL